MFSLLRDRLNPSFFNGTLTPQDAWQLTAHLLLRRPLDQKSDVRDYEAAVAKVLGVPYVFALGAGRMGLYVLLKALNLAPGSEVILPGYTCVVMPNAVRFAGYTPRYIDIRLDDLNLDPQALEAAITSKTEAVLMQHTFGIPADVDTIRDICRRHHLFLIEDGAHALGAIYDGKPVAQWGDAGLFSTETSKMISTDMGGLLVTQDSSLAVKIRCLYESLPIRSLARERLACERIIYNILTQNPKMNLVYRALYRILGRLLYQLPPFHAYHTFHRDVYDAELNGRQFDCYPRRLSGILSRAGLMQVGRLQQDVKERNQKAAMLEKLLPRFGARVPVYDHDKCYPSFVRYPFLVEDRERWTQALSKVHLPCGIWLDDPLHPKETRCHMANGYQWGSCPNAEYAAQHILNLPVGRTASHAMLARLEKLQL